LALPALTPVVRVLLIANVAVQLVQFVLAGRLSDWFGASVTSLAEPPWLLRLLTYQFVHQYQGLGHLVMNMLVLYMFGTMVEEALGRRRFLRLYLLCGLSGGIFWLLASLVMGMTGVPVVGASGCVYGVIAYAAVLYPHAQVIFILFPLRLWILAALLGLFAVYDMMVALRGGPTGGVADAAHVGGMAFALLWWKSGPLFAGLEQRLAERARRREHQRRLDHERELDELLVKVKQAGLTGLTDRERRRLTELSRERDG
jgi:membrane associated rhomboid family serine protease